LPEVLSQSEIDALLNALSSGEVDVQEMKDETTDRKVKKYDFRNPQKIAKDQLRTLEIIHDNLSRLLQSFLSGYLRTPVKISVLTVDQYAYSEFSNAISNPAFLSIVNFEPLTGQVMLDVSSNIAFTIIDRLLGGSGEKISEVRNFTEIEITLLKKIMYKIIDFIAQAWENVITLTPSLEKIETNSQFAQIVSPNETVALITMNISIGSIEGMVNFCIPHIVLEPIMNKLSTRLWFSSTKNTITKSDNAFIEKRLKVAPVVLSAEIGSSKITVRELLDLQIGDVINLKSQIDNELKIMVGSNVKYLGIPGTSKNKVAVKITRVKKDGDEIDDR